jgi:hypothetical protein
VAANQVSSKENRPASARRLRTNRLRLKIQFDQICVAANRGHAVELSINIGI